MEPNINATTIVTYTQSDMGIKPRIVTFESINRGAEQILVAAGLVVTLAALFM